MKTIQKISHSLKPLSVRDTVLRFEERPYVMGILNVTPDSFSDGGKYDNVEAALTHAEKLVSDGADIIDIGGESTRPGSRSVSLEEELTRVVPVIRAIRRKEVNVPISIDTTKAVVAEEALKAGADMINDISAGRFDEQMFSVAARADCPIILMHTLDKPENMQLNIKYRELFGDIVCSLNESIVKAVKIGVNPEKIIIDPGLGFGKTFEQNLVILNRLEIFKILGCPILVGPSNKRFIGEALGRDISERLMGTAAAVAVAIANGAHIVRVHQAREMNDVVNMVNMVRKEDMDA